MKRLRALAIDDEAGSIKALEWELKLFTDQVELVGSTQDVLVEGPGKQGGYSGRTEQNEIVHLGAASDPSGEILRVRIVQAFKNSLVGEAVDPARRASFDNARSTERRQLPVV